MPHEKPCEEMLHGLLRAPFDDREGFLYQPGIQRRNALTRIFVHGVIRGPGFRLREQFRNTASGRGCPSARRCSRYGGTPRSRWLRALVKSRPKRLTCEHPWRIALREAAVQRDRHVNSLAPPLDAYKPLQAISGEHGQ